MGQSFMEMPFSNRGDNFMWIHSSVFQNATNDDCLLTIKKISQRQISKICRIDKRGLILFKGWFYSEINQYGNTRNKVIPLENKVTKEGARKFLEKIEKNHKKYSSVLNLEFYLVGSKLYEKHCKKSELSITETGNTLFGDWWSLWIEPNHNENLKYKKFTRSNFEKSMAKAQKWVKSHKKKIFFSYPKIQWHKGSKNL